ncbi:lipoprotein [Halorubrum sp. AJ67]|uniref:lipoprotein n=1 Tax=Halorubrum sp. AJ67 TaxID=1173487 RepID=UPI0003DBF96F|nr:lipoprotein [Halorubrum sp. AJ67]CDK38627.1 copG/Arc/MetJ family transcriptional regulator protein [Halorubrum sp. AJ67]
MVKSTVRFPEPVVEEIESLVEEGQFESKSEFYRFSADYVLSRTLDEYEPETIDYDAIEAEVIPAEERELGGDGDDDGPPFFDSVAFVRKLALRGKFSDAEDFIDHQYVPGDRHAVLLEEILQLYREDAATEDRPPAPEHDPEPTTRSR